MEAIKGNIGAIPDFTVTVVFSPQRHGSKDGARGSRRERMIYPSNVDPFTYPPLPAILAAANSLAT
jgi:hypothetical protein